MTVPNKIRNLNTPLQNKPIFLFKVNSKQQVMLPLMNDTSFAYNGNVVTHRQAYEPVNNDDAHKFFNIPLMVMVNCSTIYVKYSRSRIICNNLNRNSPIYPVIPVI